MYAVLLHNRQEVIMAGWAYSFFLEMEGWGISLVNSIYSYISKMT
jgi:hypothetical protein